jgi:cell division protease FtsH
MDYIHNNLRTIDIREDWNEIIQHIRENKIDTLFIDNNYNEIVALDKNPLSFDAMFHHTTIKPIMVDTFIKTSIDHHVSFYFTDFMSSWNWQHVWDFLPIVPLLFIGWRLLSQLPMMFDDTITADTTTANATFESWLGSPEVLEECKEVLFLMKNKGIVDELKIETPRGILLEGPPGTGKTLLAKVMASESESTFLYVSGSEFIEMFVGLGAQRVRKLFQSARSNSPCVIFIDEIDTIGRKRGNNHFDNSDEQEQTLNQILAEMDGIKENKNILVVGATNRKDSLDPALLRAGRFDRIIHVPLPDLTSREKILQYYLEERAHDDTINISYIASLTQGFSGAELKNIINEAAILSARHNATEIGEIHLVGAIERKQIGILKRDPQQSEALRKRVAVHEAGHSMIVLFYNESFTFQKASIQPSYSGSGGHTIYIEKDDDNDLYTKTLLKQKLVVSLGGKAAEFLFYGGDNEVSLGSSEDLKQANALAQLMVEKFGMGGEGLEVFSSNRENRPLSQYNHDRVDDAVDSLMSEAYKEAKRILLLRYENFLLFSEALLQKTILHSHDLQTL